jgi:hypothetical protein
MYNERRDEDWINPPEEKDDYEPDVDRDNDDMWLRKKEEEEHDADTIDEHDCCRGDCK